MYRGRFAPSPTGALHIGSLTCALASWLDARAAGGEWLVRIEDLDPPREKPGAADDILRTLEAFGLYWDGEVVYQSRRHALYEAALARLAQDGHAFRCALSRAQLEALGNSHPGRTASASSLADSTDFAWRLDAPPGETCFDDRIQGRQCVDLVREGGPFVIRRRDGLFAYQLAVVVDDADQGITDVVRGSDLLDSTPRQQLLQQLLGLPTPRYAHIPVLVDAVGEKLSKQARAAAVSPAYRLDNLRLALRALGQPAPVDTGSTEELLSAAVKHWSMACVPRQTSIPLAHLL